TGRVPGRSASEVITGLRAGAGAVCGLDHDVFAGRHGLERVGAPLRQGPTVSGGGLAGEGVDAFGEKRTGRRREAGGHGAHTLVVVLPEPHGTGEGGVLTSPRDALRVEIGHDLPRIPRGRLPAGPLAVPQRPEVVRHACRRRPPVPARPPPVRDRPRSSRHSARSPAGWAARRPAVSGGSPRRRLREPPPRAGRRRPGPSGTTAWRSVRT